MDFPILYALQSIHTPLLDSFFVGLTTVAGDYGQLWLILAIVLLFFKKTRKCAIAILIAYIATLLFQQFVLKDLIARPRPFTLDPSIPLLVKAPTSFSCPSTHTGMAFAAAVSVFCFNKKWGLIPIAAALLIGFSRLYLFMHFPTDVLLGAVVGTFFAIITYFGIKKFYSKKEKSIEK